MLAPCCLERTLSVPLNLGSQASEGLHLPTTLAIEASCCIRFCGFALCPAPRDVPTPQRPTSLPSLPRGMPTVRLNCTLRDVDDSIWHMRTMYYQGKSLFPLGWAALPPLNSLLQIYLPSFRAFRPIFYAESISVYLHTCYYRWRTLRILGP